MLRSPCSPLARTLHAKHVFLPTLTRAFRNPLQGPSKGDRGLSLLTVRRDVSDSFAEVVIAMSGGVDSSVTARLLADHVRRSTMFGTSLSHAVFSALIQDQYDLSAIFMRNWDTRDESGSDRGCEWEKDWEDVQRVCRHLSLPCELVCFICCSRDSLLTRCVRQIDLSKDYWNDVFEPSLRLWEAGETPNPDVWCNRYGMSRHSAIHID